MNPPSYDLAWFLGTSFGAPFNPLDAALYETAFSLAECELKNLKCWCPDKYPLALQLQLSLILADLNPTPDGQIPPASASSDYKAFVKKDQVFDTTREYHLKMNEASGPGGFGPRPMLARLKAACKAPLVTAASMVSGFVNDRGCGCGGCGCGDCSGHHLSVGDKTDPPTYV